jgi:hypothetical protein
MPLSVEEQRLLDWAVGSLPRWFTSTDRAREELYAYAKQFDSARAVIQDLLGKQIHVSLAEGIWLDQHARDRGTSRQADESDDVLRARLINVPDVVTLPAIKSLVDTMLSAAGVVGASAFVTLRRDRFHWGTYTATGRDRAYWSRGFRWGKNGKPSGFVVILPFGTSVSLGNAVQEAVRRVKMSGVYFTVEIRGVP